jgi:D-alanyl-D-alanine carboxypeptidase
MRIRRLRVAGVLAAIAAALGSQLLASSSSTARSPIDVVRSAHGELPGAAGLDPALRGALRRAAADAAGEGVELVVVSGRRSPAHQAELFREAVAKYGSVAEAARWVATPNTSAHVSGDAVDMGPSDGAAWLSEHGAEYGLCQIYANEPWHYELRPDAMADGCPPMYADPTQDPRMQG